MSTAQAGTFLPLLLERDVDLKVLALETLLGVVDVEWSAISESLSQMYAQSIIHSKSLHYDPQFPKRDAAAYLCSKVYYHLGDRDEALNLALESGVLFNLEQRSQFNECLTWHCIDQYVQHQQSNGDAFPSKKEQMVVNVIRTSCKQGNQFSALGVSFDCRRLDLVQEILKEVPVHQLPQVLQLAYNIKKGEFRDNVLRQCVQAMLNQNKKLHSDEWGNFVSVLVQLNEVGRVAEILWELIQGDDFILAYQIAIDLADNQRPHFINQLVSSLPVQEHLAEKRSKLITILTGELQRKATLHFLKEHNQADQSILSQIKTATDPKQSVPHGAALMAHAIMQTGTQDSSFLRNNIDWATKCNYWLRFTTTATLGMIYKGAHERSTEVLSSYLPGGQGSSNVFENGGALFALGLINQGNRSPDIIQRLTDAVRNPQLAKSEQVIHGACLGLGLVTFASEDAKTTDLLRELLFKNESIYGEAAALGIGLTHAGSGSLELAKELLQFSRSSDKDKIIRQLGTSIAVVLFGLEDRADELIEQMLNDTEPYIRYGGCLALAMAYVGTGSNKVIEKLLQQAVNDVADEVRRVAVISLAFVLFRNYEQIPKVMRLLILSYNPHIRYGTALALGIACAGTMYSEAINMLEPMLSDNVDFVRQAALIGMSLVMMQANPNCEPKFEAFKKTVSEMQAKKHETVLVKLGVYLSQGILDAGGRNLTVQMSSKQGLPKLEACVGMLIFSHYWFWFPFMPFFSMALTPSALIGLNENLAIPKKFQFQSNSKPSMYGYPPHIKPDEKKVAEKKTVQLSTTNRVRARQSRKEAERQGLGESSVISLRQGESQMSLEQPQSQQGLNRHASSLIQNPDAMKPEEPAPVKKEEPATTLLSNPSRVLEKQKKVIQYLSDQRYDPIFKDRKQGLIMLVDKQPGDADECIELFAKPKPAVQQPPQPQQGGHHQVHPIQTQPAYQALDEVEPPEDFEYNPDQAKPQ